MRHEERNKLTLHPKDYIVFSGGLKIENVGDMVITLEPPSSFEISPVKEPKIISVSVEE